MLCESKANQNKACGLSKKCGRAEKLISIPRHNMFSNVRTSNNRHSTDTDTQMCRISNDRLRGRRLLWLSEGQRTQEILCISSKVASKFHYGSFYTPSSRDALYQRMGAQLACLNPASELPMPSTRTVLCTRIKTIGHAIVNALIKRETI